MAQNLSAESRPSLRVSSKLAGKIAPCFIGEEGGSIQLPQEVAIVCPHREFEGLQRVTGPLGARSRSRLHSPWLLRLAQRELDETNKLHTEGIQSLGSPMTPLVGQRADVLRELFCKPEREIAGYLPKHFFHCINRILNHNSAAIDKKGGQLKLVRRANLSCMDVKENGEFG